MFNFSEDDFNSIWSTFFDLNTDYASLIESFSDDEILYKASVYSSGIRILKQDPWEALCSFIISQNNNIPRIKGIIQRMSEKYGERIYDDKGNVYYAFPAAKALYDAGEEEIYALKTGFRAKYIYDCAKKIVEEEISLKDIYSLSLQDSLAALQTIKGVGPKVASCALLFGFGKYDAFPVDVCVKKILQKYYSSKECLHFSDKHAGIAQQYLFYYERCINNVYL